MANEEQDKLWNGSAGAAWVEAQAALDRMFLVFEELLVEAVASENAKHVLDVGCGTGATTLAVSRRLGSSGRSTGIDLSQPMIELARRRASAGHSAAEFIVADAQTHVFGAARFDMIISRFGVMFFEDPVRAFANLRQATTPAAALRCWVFRSAAENPFMTAAERAAAPLLPDLPARRADGPGQFAFADARKVHGVLESAGWSGIEIAPIDVPCALAAHELDDYLTRLGPVGLALRGADEATRRRVIEAVRTAFAPYLQSGEVRFAAACWQITARAPLTS